MYRPPYSRSYSTHPFQIALAPMKFLILCGSSLLLSNGGSAFLHPARPCHRRGLATTVFAKKNKGFGRQNDSETSKKPQADISNLISKEGTIEQLQVAEKPPPTENAGQRALQEMRRQKAEEKDAELRRVKALIQADQQVQEAPAAIPEKVAQRMGARMLPFVGLPLFLGMGAFITFWYLATYKNLEYEPSLVAASTIGILVAGLLGITYSLMSSSWDPEREGSLLGTEEFSRNVNNIKEGLGRSRENAILREKMQGLGQDELDKAVEDLDRRDKLGQRKKSSLASKLDDELS